MSDVQTLLYRCRAIGVELSPLPNGNLKVRAPAPLPEAFRAELKQKKAELLPLLSVMTWLRCRLTQPQLIAAIIAEWCGGEHVRGRDCSFSWEGGRDGTNERFIDDLMQARWALGVVAYVGEDGRFWWCLPVETVQ